MAGLYYLEGPMPYAREKILPAAWLDLKISFGSAIEVYKADRAEPFTSCDASWSVGLWNEYHVVDWPSDVKFFGVFFKPGGAYPFLQVPLSELHNHAVQLELMWGQAAAEIRERLYAEPTRQAGLALLERLLLERLRDTPAGLRVVQYALSEIERHRGALTVRALSEQIGISQNHLETHFKRLVGGTPKEVARLYRFQHAIDCLNPAQPVDLTVVAHEALYYDQSHFNKDFAAYTGHNPSDYLRLRQCIYSENPHYLRNIRQLPLEAGTDNRELVTAQACFKTIRSEAQ